MSYKVVVAFVVEDADSEDDAYTLMEELLMDWKFGGTEYEIIGVRPISPGFHIEEAGDWVDEEWEI